MNIDERYKGRYVPKSLSKEDKKKQIESIKKQTIRPKTDYPSKESKWTKKAKKYFKGDTSLENISKSINVPIEGLKEIIKKGEKAYFVSGSRPNTQPFQWGMARLYSLLFGTPKLRQMDQEIINKYNIPILKGGSLSVEDIKRPKKYLSNELKNFLELISFDINNINILGSFNNRAFFYPADIDINEKININKLSSFIKSIREKIKYISNLDNVFIMDIKLGNIKEWEVVDETSYIENNKIYGYNDEKSKNKLKELLKNKIITNEEYNKWFKMLIKKPNEEELQIIKKEVRPNLLRWKPKDIIKGFLDYRGYKISMKDAINTGGLFKIDYIIIQKNNYFQDINIVFDIRIKNLKNENGININPKRELENEIKTLKAKGDYFKALKRKFSLSKITNNKNEILRLYKILNSDLGVIHQISSNIELLLILLSESTINKKINNKLNIFIDGFIDRLNNIISINDYFNNEQYIINSINNILKTKNKNNKIKKLEKLKLKLDTIKNKNAKKYF
jgi:hypothetical protein